jgi:HlyD family secretion protein
VKRIGADLTHEQAAAGSVPAAPYYLVRVTLRQRATKHLGDFQLVPGMPAEVFIRTHDRTPLDYLLKPLREQISRAFRER